MTFKSVVRHLGLSGSDGDLSHTKVFGYAVLLAYSLCESIPASVAITLVISAHGTKALMNAIDKGVFSLKASDSTNISVTKSHTIEERKGWDSEREYQAS